MFQDSTWYAHFNDDHKLNKEQQTMQEELWSSESLHIKKTQKNKHYKSFYIFKTKIKDCTRITHKISTWQIVASSHFAQWFSLCLWQQVKNKTKNRIRMRNRNWDLDTVPFIFIFVNFKKRKHLYPKILPQQL